MLRNISKISIFAFMIGLLAFTFPVYSTKAQIKKLPENIVTYCIPESNIKQSDLTLLFVGNVDSINSRSKDANFELEVSPKEWYVQNGSSDKYYLITPQSNIVAGHKYIFYTNESYAPGNFEWSSSCMYPQEITPEREATLVNPLIKYDFFSFDKNLGTGMTDPDVIELQKFLNENNYLVSKEGLGSKGNENNYFGTKTRAALAQFQKDHAEEIGIRVATGFFGEKTREFVNNSHKQNIINQEICSAPRVLVDPYEFKYRRGIDGSFVGYVKKNGQYFSINGYVLDTDIPLDAYVDRFVSIVGKLRQYYVGEKYFEEIQPQKIVCERIPVVLSIPEGQDKLKNTDNIKAETLKPTEDAQDRSPSLVPQIK